MRISSAPLFELPISVPPRGSRHRVQALHGQLRAAIINGRLKTGLRMPPSRALADSLGVSRNTAVAVYEQLLGEGYLIARRGAGTYVARVLSDATARKAFSTVPTRDRRLNAFWRKTGAPLVENSPPPDPAQFNFRLGVPDRTLFPFDIWRRLSARALRAFSKEPLSALELQGRLKLREAISKHVSVARAVACQPDDVIVTAGAQQAFDLIARILVTPGKTVVALEEPGYPMLRAAFALSGAKIVPVRVDEEGLAVDRLPRETRIICSSPSHQYPLGTVMSLRRRAELLEFAQKRRAVIIEDDYDGEFRFGGGPVDALQTLDRAGCVFYVGTFSKCLFPDIRMGFVVAPAWARHALISARVYTDFHAPTPAQETLAAFITEGHLASHVRKMRRVYDERRQFLFGALQAEFSELLEPLPFPAGLHLTALSRSLAEEKRIVERAALESIKMCDLSRFYAGKPAKAGVVLGYGAIDRQRIEEAMGRLRGALRRPAGRRL